MSDWLTKFSTPETGCLFAVHKRRIVVQYDNVMRQLVSGTLQSCQGQGMSPQTTEPNNGVVRVYCEDLNVEYYEQTRLEERAFVFPQLIYDAAVDCTLLFNREVIDILQRNLNANFSFLRRLAGVRSLDEIVELQAAHFGNQTVALIGQAEELAALITQATIKLLWPSSIPGVSGNSRSAAE